MSRRSCLHVLGLVLVAGCTVTTETSTNSCSADPTVTGCIGSSQGYSCTGSATPDETVLNCSSGVLGNAGSTTYCCLPAGATSGTCAPDPTVTTCATGLAGYSCKGSDTPQQSDSTLTCGAATAGNAGSSLYCCSSSSTINDAGICAPSSAATCTGGATGYACTGTNTPTTANPSLSCGSGTPGGSSTLYCCATPADAGTCAQDTSGAANCSGGAVGYACSGSLTPSSLNSMLSCGGGTPWTGGQTLFCCQTGTASDAGSACGVGVSSGSATCDSCLESTCCGALTACDTPDDGGVNDAGMSQCEALVGCILDCVAGNADAGIAAGTTSSCESVCNPTYSASEQASAQALLACETSNCSAACQ
ncbi:MAG TPA: hypothetical protein VKU41_13175 [Polyangiaceae bacterium]|nr:hypothetical protein [Polyangiaceae bacterium]